MPIEICLRARRIFVGEPRKKGERKSRIVERESSTLDPLSRPHTVAGADDTTIKVSFLSDPGPRQEGTPLNGGPRLQPAAVSYRNVSHKGNPPPDFGCSPYRYLPFEGSSRVQLSVPIDPKAFSHALSRDLH